MRIALLILTFVIGAERYIARGDSAGCIETPMAGNSIGGISAVVL